MACVDGLMAAVLSSNKETGLRWVCYVSTNQYHHSLVPLDRLEREDAVRQR